MTDTWLKAIHEGKLVWSAMIDFHKAFNLVDHQLLLKKVRIYQISNMSLYWFKSYQRNRTEQAVISDCSSVNRDVLCGVPRGSILGPLLFLLFINDLPLSLKASLISVVLCADDTTFYRTVSDETSVETNQMKHRWKLIKLMQRQKRQAAAN